MKFTWKERNVRKFGGGEDRKSASPEEEDGNGDLTTPHLASPSGLIDFITMTLKTSKQRPCLPLAGVKNRLLMTMPRRHAT
jgi:hypothetical protein